MGGKQVVEWSRGQMLQYRICRISRYRLKRMKNGGIAEFRVFPG
jgi:hypothetical protein